MLLEVLWIVLISVGFFYFLGLKRTSKTSPPGPFKWPIIGNVLDIYLADPRHPHIAIIKLAKKYGDIMSLQFGAHNAVVLSSYSSIKEISKHPGIDDIVLQFPFVADRNFHKNLGIIWATGSVWQEMRKYTLRSLKQFGFGRTEFMDSLMKEEVDDLIQFLKSSLKTTNGVLSVDLNLFTRAVVNTLWNLIGGQRFPQGDQTLAKNMANNNRLIEVIGPTNLYNAFPFLKKWFPKLVNEAEHIKIHECGQDFMRFLIEDTKKRRMDRSNWKDPENFIEAFIDEIDKNSGDPQTLFTVEQLIIVLQDLFLGGTETTSNILNWAILYLTLNPQVQTKLQQEIDSVVPSGKSISLHDSPNMVYANATILETFRMADVLPNPLPRCLATDAKLKNYLIPKGTAIFFDVHSIFRDEKYWGDPNVFRPERFIDETTGGINLNHKQRASPFGSGKRACLADAFATESLFMYLTNVCRHFQFEPITGIEYTDEPADNGTTLMPKPFSVQVHLRN